MDNNIKLTPSQIKYMIYLYRLSPDGYGVKNVELARMLGISKPSVHNMLRSLIELGIVRQETFRLAFLSELGRSLTEQYYACYRVIERKMTGMYGEGVVSENAICALLADMPNDSLERLCNDEKGET